jgi:hypothetical protein
VLSWRSLGWERLSAEAAGRSAQEAERANRLAQRALELRGPPPTAESSGESQGIGPDVGWRIERPQGDRFVLRNTGAEIAEHVFVDESQLPPIHRNLPVDTVIRPGEGHDMLLKGARGHPMPNQVYVRWEGHPEWFAVPIA